MDKITHEVRLANWKTIVDECNNRPKGMSAKQWLSENDINEKTYYYWLRRIRGEAYSQLQPELPMTTESAIPIVSFAEIPIPDSSNTEDVPFKADVVIRTGSFVIGIANSASESLLSKVLGGISHAR